MAAPLPPKPRTGGVMLPPAPKKPVTGGPMPLPGKPRVGPQPLPGKPKLPPLPNPGRPKIGPQPNPGKPKVGPVTPKTVKGGMGMGSSRDNSAIKKTGDSPFLPMKTKGKF